MMEEGKALLRRWHRLQSRAESCVAACHAIVDASRGGEGIETDAYPALVGEMLDPSDVTSIDLVVARLKRQTNAIVTVAGPRWMDIARLAGRSSPYGDLGPGLHAVVLVAFDPVNKLFVVLDPYFPTADQPISVSRDDLAASWSGEVQFYSR